MIQFRKQLGFTLLELMVSMALMVILISIGVPNFTSFIKDNRLRAVTNSFVMDVNFARSEAIKRGTQVFLCRSADPQASTPSCGGSSNDWSTGWLLFASEDSNSVYDSGTDILIKRSDIEVINMTLVANSEGDSSIGFNGDGTKSGTTEALLAICDDRDNDGDFDEAYGRLISIINTGRPRLTVGSTTTPISSCSAPS